MDFRDLVLTRRTVHSFTPEKVDDKLVKAALALSLWAPNHKLTYPWVYVWLNEDKRARLGDLNVELKAAKGPLSDVKARAARDNVTTPSHLIALGMKRSSSPTQEHEDYATLACSVQIMSLFLWQHGVATKWTTGGWGLHERAYEIMGVDPAAVRLEGCLMIGRALHKPPAPERPSLDKVLVGG
jgi:nitroreductase